MDVGTLVSLKVSCLGNSVGSIGVVYENYNRGASVIFKNGAYDGFSEEEQKMFLEEIGFCEEVSYYNFVSVVRLSEDFRKGFFDPVFKRALS